jgi:hypothetical protein
MPARLLTQEYLFGLFQALAPLFPVPFQNGDASPHLVGEHRTLHVMLGHLVVDPEDDHFHVVDPGEHLTHVLNRPQGLLRVVIGKQYLIPEHPLVPFAEYAPP